MIFRNSLLSVVRSKRKSILFTLVIFALTVILALGVSVWASVVQFLEDCDDFYTTIGLVEYMGTDYPNATAYDATMDQALKSLDVAAIKNDDAVIHWEEPAVSFGYVDGFWRTDSLMPGKMLSVLVVGNISYDERNKNYYGIVMKSLFSYENKDDIIIYIDGDFGAFEPNHYYLVFGEMYHGQSPLLHLRKASYVNTIASLNGANFPYMLDITVDDADGHHFEIPEDAILTKIARTLPVTNNSVLVTGTDDLMALLPFHQQELYLVDGRAFSPEEYAQGQRVAVISDLMAKRLGIGVGDTIDLSAAVSDQPGFYNNYWVNTGFSYNAVFTVVGITNTVMDKSWYIFVPRAAGVPVVKFPVGYIVGYAIVQNNQAADFYSRIESELAGRFQITIYDQGYSTVAIPFQTILSIAKIVTVVCGLVELAVLILFGFLFVYRQRETSETMLMLGAGKMRTSAYFIYSSALISLIATFTGSFTALLLHDRIISLVARSAGRFALIDSRYSNGNLTISRTLEFAPQLSWQLFMWVGAVVLFMAVLFCLAFTISTFIHNQPSKKGLKGPNKEQQTSRLGGSSLKYALLSIQRGGYRSAVVPVLALSVVVFFGQLSTTAQRYQEQLDSIYDGTSIQGYYTDIYGKQIGNQMVYANDVMHLFRNGQVNTLNVSKSESYYYLGISRFSDGQETGLEPLYVPDNFFRREALEETILRGSYLTATNDIRTAPDFFYSKTIDLTFMDGMTESVLKVPYGDEKTNTCIVPSSWMAENGIQLGDVIRVAINDPYNSLEYNKRIFRHYDLKVVGSYEKQGAADTIYAPLSLFFNTGLIWGEGQQAEGISSMTFGTGYQPGVDAEPTLQRIVFNSTNFTLSNSRDLGEFKDYLSEYGYSQVKMVNSVREFIVLKDAAFNNAVASTKQQIRYINTLYPILYLFVGIIGLVVSYLMVLSRKSEIAIMRGLGSTSARTFISFFAEQSILSTLGALLGLALWWMLSGTLGLTHLLLSAGFLICYFIGSALSIIIMNHSQVLLILLDKD
jgi:ABC-type lipoprotein release transport system permease subunit